MATEFERMAVSSATRWIGVLGLAICVLSPAFGQVTNSTGQTVRHRRVAVEDETQPPEVQQAEAAITKKDYAAALPLLERATQHNEKNYLAWFDLGFVLNALGRSEDAIAAYRKSVAAKPDVFESNLNLGLMLARANHSDAATFLHAATQLKPTDHVEESKARAWSALGHVLEAAKPEEAAAAYREAAQLQPKDPEPYFALGALLERQKDIAGAEAAYRQALQLAPTSSDGSSDAITALANLYMSSRRFTEAEAMLRQLAAAHPDDAVLHVQLGRVLGAEGKNDEAIAEMGLAAKSAPLDPAAALDLAELYERARKYPEAEAAYRQLLTKQPANADLHHALGKILLAARKFPEAQSEFLQTVKLQPDRGAAYGDLAAAANENKDYPLVIRALDVRGRFLPENAAIYFLRASAYDHLRDAKKAAENYHKFLESAQGQYPDQEWQARHRLIAIEPKK
jgi:Flp pilus assembly protein TadD